MLKDFLFTWLTVLGITILIFSAIALVIYLAAFVNFFLGVGVGFIAFTGFLAGILCDLIRRT
jgi:hypothetical protein